MMKKINKEMLVVIVVVVFALCLMVGGIILASYLSLENNVRPLATIEKFLALVASFSIVGGIILFAAVVMGGGQYSYGHKEAQEASLFDPAITALDLWSPSVETEKLAAKPHREFPKIWEAKVC